MIPIRAYLFDNYCGTLNIYLLKLLPFFSAELLDKYSSSPNPAEKRKSGHRKKHPFPFFRHSSAIDETEAGRAATANSGR